jgi:hypothetical protein
MGKISQRSALRAEGSGDGSAFATAVLLAKSVRVANGFTVFSWTYIQLCESPHGFGHGVRILLSDHPHG